MRLSRHNSLRIVLVHNRFHSVSPGAIPLAVVSTSEACGLPYPDDALPPPRPVTLI
jgi:hypothetical protein